MQVNAATLGGSRATPPTHSHRALYVGASSSELLNLEWSDVDMPRKEFTLRHTKNDESRIVPMTPEVYRVFTELWQERRLDTQRVFLYNGKPVRDVKTALKKACRQAGITNFRLHDLRHTAIRFSDGQGWTPQRP